MVALWLLIPCSLKKEIKGIMGIPTAAATVVEKPKLLCSTSVVEQSQHKSNQKKVTDVNKLWFKNSGIILLQQLTPTPLPDAFTYLHVKTPVIIRHQQFLI
jgi:hypothetical protein